MSKKKPAARINVAVKRLITAMMPDHEARSAFFEMLGHLEGAAKQEVRKVTASRLAEILEHFADKYGRPANEKPTEFLSQLLK